MAFIPDRINVTQNNDNCDKMTACKRIIAANAEMDDPFFVCDLDEVINRYLLMKKLMPRVTQYYAMKCNSYPIIVKTMATIGCNFECASEKEIAHILNLGVPPTRILFGHPIKSVHHITFAMEHHVDHMTFDTDDELYKIKTHAPTAQLILRLRCDAKNCDFMLGDKFGCDPQKDGPKLLKLAKNLELSVVGVSFHVGSGIKEMEVYDRAIRYSRELFDFAMGIGYTMNILDIGGGLYGYTNFNVPPVTEFINAMLEKYFPVGRFPKLQIVTEFGQYYVAASFVTVCNIIGKKKMTSNSQIWYYINDSVYKNFIVALCNIEFPLPQPLHQEHYKSVEKFSSKVWGCSNQEEDLIYADVQLPEMACGDWMVIDEIGAYSMSLETDYSGFAKNECYPIITENYFERYLRTSFDENEINKLE